MPNKDSFQKIRRLLYYNFRKIFLYFKNSLNKKKKHDYLFILSPPFCGSTLLNELISTSKNISCNNNIGTREGQTLPLVKDIMFDRNRWDENKKIPWKKIKKVWHLYWDLSKPILLDKSTTNIMRINELRKFFSPIFFIVIVRNPYAQCEGIIRRNNKSADFAAKFTLNCLKLQRNNIESGKDILFINYEEICDSTIKTIKKIQNINPLLNDIKIKNNFKAHNYKSKKRMKIINLNKDKIAKLTDNQIKIINSYFHKEKELLEYFKYSII